MKYKSYLIYIPFVLVLSLGCFWQIVSICQLFFSYPTNIFIESEFDVFEIRLPSLTLCTNIGNKSRGKTAEEVFKTFNIKQIVKSISYMYSNAEIKYNYQFVEHSIESLSMTHYCFTLNSYKQVGEPAFLEQYDYVDLHLANFGKNDNWWFFLHNSDDMPVSNDWNAVEVKKSFWYCITFSLNTYHLLRSPYPSNCKQYTKESDFHSRKDCIRKCKINLSQRKCGVVSHEVDVYKNETNVRFADTSKELNCVRNLNLKRNCLKMCPNYDCFKQHYVPKITAEYTWDNTSVISLAIPTEPQLTHYEKPRIETIEFLCFIASTLSLWFGFTMISVYHRFHSFYKHAKFAFFDKFQDKPQNNQIFVIVNRNKESPRSFNRYG